MRPMYFGSNGVPQCRYCGCDLDPARHGGSFCSFYCVDAHFSEDDPYTYGLDDELVEDDYSEESYP